MIDIRVVNNAGHYDVYLEGAFYCSADTYSEAIDEVEKCLEKEEK